MRLVAPAVALALAVVVACSDGADERPDSTGIPTTTSLTAEGERCRGDDVNLALEPKYQVDYLHRGSRGGCPVRLDVITLGKPGADFHCAPWPTYLVVGTPVGVPHEGGGRQYARDPASFDPNAVVPDDAVKTDYRVDGAVLWVAEDGSSVYLAYPDRTERWPLWLRRCA